MSVPTIDSRARRLSPRATRRLARRVVACVAAIVSASCTTDSGVPPPDGMFTEAQAVRGRTVYAEACAACHGTALTEGSAPALAGPVFELRWRHPNVILDDMFFLQRTTMPPKAAPTVSPEDHAAVFAFLLQSNGYTAGKASVVAGAHGLRQTPRWVSAPPARGTPAAPAFIAGEPGAAPAASGPTQAVLIGAGDSTDWLHHTHDYSGTRFSPLDRINVENVTRLARACAFGVGEANNFQTGPLVHAGTMYVTTTTDTVALDAATCEEKWRHRWTPRGLPAWRKSRGVALKDGRLVRGTSDGYLLSLTADTGALLWARRVATSEEGETFSMAPLIFENLILIGPAGSENNIQGWVGAFRLEDGEPVWRFHTVPRPGEPGAETWHNPTGIPTGGGAVWTSFSLDPDTGELYIAVANPAPDLPVHLRGGDNLYTNSIVCLDVRTGERRWHHSFVPNDSHDWDLTHAGRSSRRRYADPRVVWRLRRARTGFCVRSIARRTTYSMRRR